MAFTLFPETARFYDLFIDQNQRQNQIESSATLNDRFENHLNVEKGLPIQ